MPLLERLVNRCIAFVSEPGCDVINFEINLIFLIRPFFDISENSRQKIKYENEKSLQGEKNFSALLKGFQFPKIFSDLRVRL